MQNPQFLGFILSDKCVLRPLISRLIVCKLYYMNLCDLTVPVLCCQGDEIQKGVFIVFFQGEQLKARVRKICEG